MTIYASCGHVVEGLDNLQHIVMKGYTRCGAHCLEYISVCEKCSNAVEVAGYVLHTEREEIDWCNKGRECCGMC